MNKLILDKDNIILDYIQIKSLKNLQKKYGHDRRTLKKVLVEGNCYIEPFKKDISDDIINIVEDYNNRITIGEISKKYSIDRKRIVKLLKENNVVDHQNHKYDFNRRIFENIDTEKKAYWFGFICADGCVYKSKDNRSNHLGIKLSSKDINHLYKFKTDFNLPHEIKLKKENGFGGGFESAMIRLTSKNLVEDLINIGCVPNKTFLLRFPQINEKLYSHFMRGYFDGDGTISRSKNNKQIAILGNYDFLLKYQEILIKNCQISKTKIYKKNKIYVLSYGGNLNVRKIGRFFYHESSTCLSRKQERF